MRSLEAPHPETAATAALGLAAWGESLPEGDSDLLDPTAGVPRPVDCGDWLGVSQTTGASPARR
jgi:hypothetical protein